MVSESRLRTVEHKVKDYDIIHDILRELKLRSKPSSRTLFVQFHGHSGDPLHEGAERLAVGPKGPHTTSSQWPDGLIKDTKLRHL